MLPKTRIQQLDVPSRKGHDAIFNSNFREDILEAVDAWDSCRIVLVASKTLDANTDNIQSLRTALGSRLAATKLGVGSHSPYADVQDIADTIQTVNADCVISVGSCSYSDATHIACMLANKLPAGFTAMDMEALVDLERGMADTKDGKPIGTRSCKLVHVPTSLSASEWNSISSATNSNGKKQHFGSWDQGFPDLILMDPVLSSTSPENLWLSSGVRCIDHCVELMCNPKSAEPDKKGLIIHAEKGLRCMIEGLTQYKQAKNEGGMDKVALNLLYEGISECQYGSREALTGLLIWRVPMGPSHAIGHQLGSVAGVMHGITSCILLAPVLRWQLDHMSDPHYAATQTRVLQIFNETLGWKETTAGDAIERFVKSVGLPSMLHEVGVTADETVNKIADMSMTDVWGGQKRQMELEDIKKVLNSARDKTTMT